MEREKITHRDIDLNGLIKGICARPKIFVGYENFRMVASFIGGFASASDYYSNEEREFNTWVAIKLGFPPNWVWFYTMEKKYPNDEDALRELPILFEEFINSRKEQI